MNKEQQIIEYLETTECSWSTKSLAKKFGLTVPEMLKIMKALASQGKIAWWLVKYQLNIGGKTVDGKKYYFGKWGVIVPSNYILQNQIALAGTLTNLPGMVENCYSKLEQNFAGAYGGHIAPSSGAWKSKEVPIPDVFTLKPPYGAVEKDDNLKYEEGAKKKAWGLTYSSSSAYNSIPYKKAKKIPLEHLEAFYTHYEGVPFGKPFLAKYFDCSGSHIWGMTLWLKNVTTTKYKGKQVAMYNPTGGPPICSPIIKPFLVNLEVIQSVGSAKVEATPTVTHGATSVDEIAPNPEKVVQWGITKVLVPVAPQVTTNASSKVMELWGLKAMNLREECANFYVLYDLMLDHPEAQEIFERKSGELVDQFCAYLDMAIGGELRHATHACKFLSGWKDKLKIAKHINKTPSDRASAWIYWKDLRADMGLTALGEAVEMLTKGSWSGAYGGKKWGTAAKTLLMFLQGDITKTMFVDTVWGMQHNTGYILNKIWNVGGLGTILDYKQAGKINEIVEYCTVEVRDLYFKLNGKE